MILSLLSLVTLVTIQPHSQIQIITKNSLGMPVGSGSAVLIDKNKVLTAFHVVKGKHSVFALCGEKLVELRPIAFSPQLDLAVAEYTQDCDIKPITLAKENPPIPADIYAIGYPGGFGFMVTKGVVSSYTLDDERILCMWSDVKVWYGNSGGPVINNQGELVGIILALSSDSTVEIDHGVLDVNSQQYSIMAPISVIKLFINRPVVKPNP